MHSGEVRLRCNVCQKGFSYFSDLVKHDRSHSGEKPYQCDICHKSFAVKSNLNKHISTHGKNKTCTVKPKRKSTKDKI